MATEKLIFNFNFVKLSDIQDRHRILDEFRNFLPLRLNFFFHRLRNCCHGHSAILEFDQTSVEKDRHKSLLYFTVLPWSGLSLFA